MTLTFRRLSLAERPYFQLAIAALEQMAYYPLGEDFFQIDHGPDYFAFFDRLGEVHYYVALADEAVVAVGAGVLRQVADQSGKPSRPAWYLCDLKVHPAYQQQRLSLRMLRYAVEESIQHCDRGYAISMNPGDSQPNRLVQVFGKISPIRFAPATTLGIYSVPSEAMPSLESLLMQYRGAISYLSLNGIKDLRLQSNQQILPLLHLQWGTASPLARPHPLPGYTCMFCAPATDALALALTEQGIEAIATASVIQHGMEDSDWRFILTSDI